MRRVLLALALSACAARPANVSPPSPARPDVASLAWLRGRWCGAHDGGTFCETWRDGPGATLRGEGAFERGGARVFGEALVIESRADGVFYVATPEGEPTTSFRLTRGTDAEAVFENPAHDFPTRITYRRAGADGLLAVVEGAARRIEFALRRAP